MGERLQIERRTIDGSVVVLHGASQIDSVPVPVPVTSAVWSIEDEPFIFVSGDISNAEGFVRAMGVSTFDQSFGYRNGSLLLGSDMLLHQDSTVAEAERRWAIWRGSASSIWVHVVGSVGSTAGLSDALLRLLESFMIDEFENGVVLQPRDPFATPLLGGQDAPSAHFRLSDLGSVEVYAKTKYFLGSLPRWPGMPVRGGELYLEGELKSENGSTKPIFALIGESTYSLITAETGIDEETLLLRVSDLQIDWLADGAGP